MNKLLIVCILVLLVTTPAYATPIAITPSSISAAPIPPDRNGIFGDTPLREDLRLFAIALAFGLGVLVVSKTIFS